MKYTTTTIFPFLFSESSQLLEGIYFNYSAMYYVPIYVCYDLPIYVHMALNFLLVLVVTSDTFNSTTNVSM